ncbi:hypothetical protein CRUP_027989 [Coryphaenoides rupestris]|nr:hypothetical protein CRUP_027989 [Coryphaenoides rupestris]
MNDALSVVAQLRDLASEPQNREAIVQDQGCLPGLCCSWTSSRTTCCWRPCRERRKKPQFFLNATNKKAKSVTLHIQGLDSTDQRGLCEEALLKVKGVISFTFQMASKRCTVRIRSDLATESSISHRRNQGVTAKQVIKNEAGERAETALCRTTCPSEEEESPEKDLDRAVSRPTATMDGNGSWISAAAGFLTKTFYW